MIYLGEGSAHYRHLVSTAIEKQEDKSTLELYEITTNDGVFNGYAVKKNEVQGFAYYNTLGDFYQFIDKDSCEVEKIATQKLAELSQVNNADLLGSVIAKRDENKEVNLYNIELFNKNTLTDYSCVGMEAFVNGVDGYIFKIKSNFMPVENAKNIFVAGNSVDVIGLCAKEKIETPNEKFLYEMDQRIISYEEGENTLEKLKLDIVGLPKQIDYINNFNKKHNNHFDHLISSINNFKHDILPLQNKKISIDAALLLIDEANTEFKYKEIEENFLKEYGVTVDVKEQYEENKLSISLVDNKGKSLSMLTVNNPLHETTPMNIEPDEDEEEDLQPIEFIKLDLTNNENYDGKEVVVHENGNDVKLEDSKFKHFYEMFDEKAFTNDESLDFSLNENITSSKNKYNIYKYENVDIANKGHLLESLRNRIEHKDNASVKKELKKLSSNNNKLTFKIK